MGHSDMLREVVLNLVDNAVKYNRPGGHVYVTMEKAETGRNLLFTVEDTGIGIQEEDVPRVFEKVIPDLMDMRTNVPQELDCICAGKCCKNWGIRFRYSPK